MSFTKASMSKILVQKEKYDQIIETLERKIKFMQEEMEAQRIMMGDAIDFINLLEAEIKKINLNFDEKP